MQSRKAAAGRRIPGAVLLDTHTIIWLADGQPKLKSVQDALKIAYDRQKLFVSVISAWEIGMLVSKGRLHLSKAPLDWFDDFVRRFNITVLDITPEIAINSSYLPGNFHGDPADRLIVATAIIGEVSVLTADKQILSYAKKGYVKALGC